MSPSRAQVTADGLADAVLAAGIACAPLSPLARRVEGRELALGAAVPNLPRPALIALARPVLRLSHRFGGPGLELGDYTLCAGADGPLAVLLPKAEGVTMFLFETLDAYLDWALAAVSTRGGAGQAAALPSQVSPATLAATLHILDLAGQDPARLFPLTEFIASLEGLVQTPRADRLASLFLALTAIQASPGLDELSALLETGLIAPLGERPARAFCLTPAGQTLAAGFAGWDRASALEVRSGTDEGPRRTWRAFLVPAGGANHLVDLRLDPASAEALSGEALKARFAQTLAAARGMGLATAPTPAPAARPAPVKAAPPPPATEAPAEPPFVLRRWLQEADDRLDRIHTIDRDHVQALAMALRKLRGAGAEPNLVKHLQAALVVNGREKARWTVGLGSLAWNRVVDGQWRPAEAPEWTCVTPAMLRASVATGSGLAPFDLSGAS